MTFTNGMGVITQFCKKALDIILPPRPIEQISIDDFLKQTERARYNIPHVQEPQTLAPLRYRAQIVRQAILALKYKESIHAAHLLAHVLHPFLLEYISDIQLFTDTNKILLVPIPLSRQRLRERGYNQAFLLATELEKLFENNECVVDDSILIRTRNTHPQTKTQSREERFKNIAGCFAVLDVETARGKTIVLIDDVITTCATVSEARQTLLAAGSHNVIALAAAH